MISTEKNGSVEHLALLVQVEVALGRVKIFVGDHVWLMLTYFFEDFSVQVEASIVDAPFALALRTHPQHRPKFR